MGVQRVAGFECTEGGRVWVCREGQRVFFHEEVGEAEKEVMSFLPQQRPLSREYGTGETVKVRGRCQTTVQRCGMALQSQDQIPVLFFIASR